MQTEHLDVLTDTFCDVLETAAFVFGDVVPHDDRWSGGESLAVSMSFAGPSFGHVTLVLPNELAIELVANVLGVEEDAPEVSELLDDGIAELLNVTCNHFLSRWVGGSETFEVGIPSVSRLAGDAGPTGGAQQPEVCLLVGDHPVRLRAEVFTGQA